MTSDQQQPPLSAEEEHAKIVGMHLDQGDVDYFMGLLEKGLVTATFGGEGGRGCALPPDDWGPTMTSDQQQPPFSAKEEYAKIVGVHLDQGGTRQPVRDKIF